MRDFRSMHTPGSPFVLVNAWDIGSARVVAALGAEAIGTTSAGFAFTVGLPDGARISRDDAVNHCRDLVAATPLPVSVDYENGYADDPGELAASVELLVGAGAAGCSIEDTAWPTTEPYELDRAVARIASAVQAARSADPDFVLLARADGVMNRQYDLDEGIRRVQAFADAGADCVYIPVLPDLTTVERVCTSVSVPVNVLVVGPLTAYRRDQFADAGVARLSLGSALARVTHRALIDTTRSVLGGDFGSLADGVGGGTVDELLARGREPG